MEFLDKLASLTPDTRAVICEKGTEPPHRGAYNALVEQGSYLCRRCGLALFPANSQFSAGCGWPSFDKGISNAVKEVPDRDGMRTEICCNRCDGHLGHVFTGEYFTEKNTRFCVNSLSLDFVPDSTVLDTEEAILAGGCFWGVEYYMKQLPGVLKVESGYSGGVVDNPAYEQICQGNTGHYEAVRVVFDIAKTTYRDVLTRFFEIHDPTEICGQGPDRGHQYRSAVFFYTEDQHAVADERILALTHNGYAVATRCMPIHVFWPAEDYHQNYYARQNKLPYCHHLVYRFRNNPCKS